MCFFRISPWGLFLSFFTFHDIFLRKLSPALLCSNKVKKKSWKKKLIYREYSSFTENCILISVLILLIKAFGWGNFLQDRNLNMTWSFVQCMLHFTTLRARSGIQGGGMRNYFSTPLPKIYLQWNIKLRACYINAGLEKAQIALLFNQMAILTLTLEIILMIYSFS